MAKKATKTTKETTNNAHINAVTLEGIVFRVLYTSDKVASYVIENHRISPKGNTIKSWLTVKEFEPKLHYEKGERIVITGELSTDSYEKNGAKVYNTVVVGSIEGVDAVDEIPFN